VIPSQDAHNNFKLPSFIPELESVRAYMAWWVVVGHIVASCGYYYSEANNWPLKIISINGHAVSVFIMLSGFLIFRMLEKPASYPIYLSRRFYRIFPLYLLLLLISIIAWDLSEVARTQATWRPASYIQNYINKSASIEAHFWEHTALHILLLQGLLPDQILNYSGEAFIAPAWSLSLEWQFYLIAPLIFKLSKLNRWYLCIIAGGFYCLNYLITKGGYTFSYGAFLPCKFEYFAIGISTALFFADLEQGLSLKNSILKQWPIAFLTMASFKLNPTSFLAVYIWIFVISIIYLKYYANISAIDSFCKIVFSRYATYLGRTSYSTYIIHPILIDIVVFAIIYAGYGGISSLEALKIIAPIVILLTVTLSHHLHRLIELPAIEFGKTRTTQWHTGKTR